jgi:hypothetical protein
MAPVSGSKRDGGGFAMMRTFKVPFLAPVSTPVKTAYRLGFVALSAALLFGCPVYSGGSEGYVQCDQQGQCCDEQGSGGCQVWYCDNSEQCPTNAVCNNNGVCTSGYYDGGYATSDGGTDDGGYDATVDCSVTGCQTGYECTLSNGTAVCLPTEDGGAGDATVDGGGDDASGDSGPSDGGIGDADARVLPPFTGCTNDTACVADSGAGSRCIDGQCVAAANECTDSTQCPIVGSAQEECVQGVCTPSCTGGATCPTGYSCSSGDGGTGACTVNPTPCGNTADAGACTSGTTCVDQHCVPDCTPGVGDAASTCTGSGLVCVDNGCIPDQKPQFICNTEGVQDSCASGSICLHHSCYISCTPGDSGASTCQHADNFNVCKPVTTSTGTYNVCGSTSNLGNQCDPTQGIICTSPTEPVCIDGYCR